MAKYRKLGRTSDQRKALLRSQVTALIYNGKIVTTEARAKEVRKMAERLITLAVKEKDNFETVKVTAKVARKDKDGKRVKQIIDKDTKAVLSETHRDKDGKILRIDNGVTVT
ncbi:MAG: 50S ribosomal protein L17, partial [Lachnospiraceae bacterium]|nr:50S ribosomal protein L17 [Lachnospiraceae bacterium]